MAKPITEWNPETKRFEVKEPEKPKVEKVKIEYERVSILKSQYDALLAFAAEDGMELFAETDQGKSVRASKSVQRYIEVALRGFIDARKEDLSLRI